MSLIFLAKGHAHMGITEMDKDGNVIKSTPAHFEYADDGPCVAVGELDPETMEVKGNADLYGDWDAAGYLAETMKRLKPGRQVNIPDFEIIVRRIKKYERIDICEHCPLLNCRDCIVKAWEEKWEEEDEE